MMAVATQRAAMERALKEAVALKRFEVHYQPLVDCRTRAVLGCEALIRWQHPDGHWIAPLDFIPLAEELGLINQVGKLVLHAGLQRPGPVAPRGIHAPGHVGQPQRRAVAQPAPARTDCRNTANQRPARRPP
jgi:hypothetical protein